MSEKLVGTWGLVVLISILTAIATNPIRNLALRWSVRLGIFAVEAALLTLAGLFGGVS